MNSYDFLKFLTVKLTAYKFSGEEKTCNATGFYAIINNIPVIVTAKHFAEGTMSVLTIPGHYTESKTVVTVPVTANVEWIESDEYDIAYCILHIAK